MSARGVPRGFFLVNRWVTQGPWLNYADRAAGLEHFQIKVARGKPQVRHLEQINQFLLALIALYRAPILALVQQRDQILQKLRASRDRRSVFADRRRAVLCGHPIARLDDIAALEQRIERGDAK